MRYGLKIVDPPAEYPVTLDEVANQVRYDLTNPTHVTEENYINGLIAGATKMLEDYCGRAFITQTLKMICVPDLAPVISVAGVKFGWEVLPEVIRIWRPPCQKVNGVCGIDTAGVVHTQNPAMYTVNLDMEPAEIKLIYGGWWEWYLRGYYVIDYDAGYGCKADVPQVIKNAILQTVGQWYKDREQSNYTIPPTAAAMLDGANYTIESWELD